MLDIASVTPEQRERLSEVFDLVKPKGNWKEPIKAFVPAEAAEEFEIIDAVVWYAGGMPDVEPAVKDGVTGFAVTGAGYYEWIGA